MYTATITSQGQITIPSQMREMLGVKGGDKLNFVHKDKVMVISKAAGWESLRGVLSEFKDKYPSKKQLAKAHVKGLGLK